MTVRPPRLTPARPLGVAPRPRNVEVDVPTGTASLRDDPTIAQRDAAMRWSRPYWQIDFAFGLYGLSWILGISGIVLPLLAATLGARLVMTRPVRVPKGFGWYLLWLGWVVLSGINLPDASRLLFFTWRFANYVSVGVFLLAIYNAPSAKLSTERVVRSLALLWVTTIVGGHLAMQMPRLAFSSPAQMVLPPGLSANEVIRRYLQPRVADVQDFLGFDVPRPSAPFVYTNLWGSNLTLLYPFVLLLVALVATPRIRAALMVVSVVALPPFIFSLNRMAWFSALLIALLSAVLARREVRARVMATVAVGALVGLLVFTFTPFAGLVEDRLETGHSDGTRSDLAIQAWEVTNESPLIGYGRPLPNIRFPLRAAIGTQGFFWTVMVAHGYVGVLLYLGWLLDALRRAWVHRVTPEAKTAVIVIVVFVVQSPFYDALPMQVHLLAVAIALERRAAYERRMCDVVTA